MTGLSMATILWVSRQETDRFGDNLEAPYCVVQDVEFKITGYDRMKVATGSLETAT
jgi:hypothetical protein